MKWKKYAILQMCRINKKDQGLPFLTGRKVHSVC